MTIVSSEEMVADARAELECLGCGEVEKMMAEGAIEVIDVRDGDERASGVSIAGSHHAGRGMLEFYIDPASDFHLPIFASGKKFVFVCGSGGRASLAAHTAKSMGLANVAILEGGMKGWIAHGGATVREG